MKKLGLAVWSLTMIGVTTVSVGALCAASWLSGLVTGVFGTEKEKEDTTDQPEKGEITGEENEVM